jgi:hypothetical protein
VRLLQKRTRHVPRDVLSLHLCQLLLTVVAPKCQNMTLSNWFLWSGGHRLPSAFLPSSECPATRIPSLRRGHFFPAAYRRFRKASYICTFTGILNHRMRPSSNSTTHLLKSLIRHIPCASVLRPLGNAVALSAWECNIYMFHFIVSKALRQFARLGFFLHLSWKPFSASEKHYCEWSKHDMWNAAEEFAQPRLMDVL